MPLGQAIEIPVEYSNEDWTENYEGTISLQINGITKGQAALDTLMAENQFNEAPPEGMEWVIFDVTMKLLDGNQDTAYATSRQISTSFPLLVARLHKIPMGLWTGIVLATPIFSQVQRYRAEW